MKRYFLLLAVAALAAVSCQEKEQDGFTPAPGTEYTLEGTVKAEGFAWAADSQLGLFSATSGVRVLNAKCPIASGAGEANATFKTPGLDLVEGENRFAVCFPYNAAVIYASGRFNNFNVSDAQTQAAPGAAASCYAVGMAAGTPGTDETFKFELNPVTAIAKVTVGTSIEKYVGQSIKKVTVSNTETALGGSFNVSDIETGEIQLLDGKTSTAVGVSVTAPEAIVAGKTQDFYINILPAELKGDVNVVIDVEKDGVAASIPVKVKDLKFEAGKVTEIDLSDIKAGDIALEAWYCADDTRLLPGLGYAYGEANTYFIQCKGGKTYAGGTYQENATISDEVTIDYRVRGNIANITPDLIPENVTFEWLTLSNGKIYTPRTNELGGSDIKFTSDEAGTSSLFTLNHDAANYKVTVKNTGTFAGAPILVMKKAGKVLWAWTFWNVAADGGVQDDAATIIAPVTVGDYKFAPMDLGQPSPLAWNASFDSEPVFGMNILYQWGRPFPILWTSYWSMDGYKEGATGNVVAVQGPLSLKESLSKVGFIYSDDEMRAWCTEKNVDLWGAAAELDKDGGKTIYDPCPKGWKVASLPAMEALVANGPAYNNEAKKPRVTFGNAVFYNNGYVFGYREQKDGKTRPINMQFQNSSPNRGWVWTGYAGEEQPQVLYWDTRSESQEAKLTSVDHSAAMSVRCIVDEKNR